MYNTQINDGEILFSREGELIRLTPCGRNAVRFQAFPGGRVLEENYNLMPQAAEAVIADHGHSVTMTCGELTVTLNEGEWVLTRDGTVYTRGYHTIRAEVQEFIALVRKGASVLDAFAR